VTDAVPPASPADHPSSVWDNLLKGPAEDRVLAPRTASPPADDPGNRHGRRDLTVPTGAAHPATVVIGAATSSTSSTTAAESLGSAPPGPVPLVPHQSEGGTAAGLLPVGFRLGNYRVSGVLGRGGMGVVYEAENVLLRRKAAVKLLPKELWSDIDALRRLLTEARVLARLEHPNIVGIYDLGESAGVWYMALQLVRGMSAADLLTMRGAFAWREATRVAADAARALSAAHRAGLVHRDVKPGNLLIGSDRVVKLADFGLALVLDSDPAVSPRLTQSGLRVGTLEYMSPEQCRGREADASSDLYSLGATYFHLLTGRPPFTGGPAALMIAHRDSPAPDPRRLVGGLPDDISRVVARALSKERHDRYPDADAMLADLEELGALPLSDESRRRLISVPDPLPPPSSGRHADAAASASASAAAVGAATDSATEVSPSPAPAPASSSAPPVKDDATDPPPNLARRRRLVAVGVGGAMVVATALYIAATDRPSRERGIGSLPGPGSGNRGDAVAVAPAGTRTVAAAAAEPFPPAPTLAVADLSDGVRVSFVRADGAAGHDPAGRFSVRIEAPPGGGTADLSFRLPAPARAGVALRSVRFSPGGQVSVSVRGAKGETSGPVVGLVGASGGSPAETPRASLGVRELPAGDNVLSIRLEPADGPVWLEIGGVELSPAGK
jgi:serine/threonine protein kinase